MLSDSRTDYLQQVCVYYGKETQLVDSDHPHTVRVVKTHVELFHNRGYDLYVDRFYSSPLLATELTKVGITVTGTVQSNRKGLPKDITADRKNDPCGTTRAARSDDILVLSWQDKRQVLMFSTKYDASIVQMRRRYPHNYYYSKIHGILQITIAQMYTYCNSWFTRHGQLNNKFMLGVDKLDQLMSYYSFLHKSVKWWRKIFFWCLEVVVINAYIIYQKLAR